MVTSNAYEIKMIEPRTLSTDRQYTLAAQGFVLISPKQPFYWDSGASKRYTRHRNGLPRCSFSKDCQGKHLSQIKRPLCRNFSTKLSPGRQISSSSRSRRILISPNFTSHRYKWSLLTGCFGLDRRSQAIKQLLKVSKRFCEEAVRTWDNMGLASWSYRQCKIPHQTTPWKCFTLSFGADSCGPKDKRIWKSRDWQNDLSESHRTIANRFGSSHRLCNKERQRAAVLWNPLKT